MEHKPPEPVTPELLTQVSRSASEKMVTEALAEITKGRSENDGLTASMALLNTLQVESYQAIMDKMRNLPIRTPDSMLDLSWVDRPLPTL